MYSSEIVPVDKFNAVVVAYTNDIHEQFLDLMYNNIIQILILTPLYFK